MKSAQSYFTVKKDYISTLCLTNEETQFPAKIFDPTFYKKLVAEGISVNFKTEDINDNDYTKSRR